MSRYKAILLILISLTATFCYSQYGWRDGNRIGLIAGPNFSNVISGSDIKTTPKIGWTAGGQVRGNFHNNWSAVYEIRFFESNFGVKTTTPGGRQQDVTYINRGAQVMFLFSYNLVEDFVSLDVGPVLQANGKLSFKRGPQNNTIDGTNLLVKDFTKINTINGMLYLGATVGSATVKANFNYVIGINNSFNKLNNQDDFIKKNNNKRFSGRTGMFSAMIQINL